MDWETVEELIYKAKNLRDRLIFELQARCGLRIGELLKIKVSDVSDRKLILRGPKSGKESEVAFMPEQIARPVNNHIQQKSLSPEDQLFPLSYSTARGLIKNLGAKLNVELTPTTSAGIRRPMPAGMECPWRLSPRFSSDTRIQKRPRCIWEG